MQFIKVNPNRNQNPGKGNTQAGNPNKQTNPEGEEADSYGNVTWPPESFIWKEHLLNCSPYLRKDIKITKH